MEDAVAAQFRALRLSLDIDQVTLADRAAVSLSALRSLESGRGSSLRTIARVARALGRVDWLDSLYEEPSISPLALVREREGQHTPRRASPRSRKQS